MATPNSSQASYLQNAVRGNSLVSQLLNKNPLSIPSTAGGVFGQSKPVSASPQAIAATSNVKNPAAPATQTPILQSVPNPAAQPNETVAAGANTPGYSYKNGVLASVGGQAVGNQAPKTPEPTTPVKKVTTNNTDGSSSTTEYHAPEPTNFPGLVGSLAGNSQAQSPLAATAGNGLIKAPNQNQKIAQEAQGIRDTYGGQISKVGNLGAGAVAGDLSTGTNIVGSGNAAIASQSASQRMSALAADEQAQLASLNPELTAQAQGQSALTSAGQLGNTAQGQLQSGLTSAASLSQPSPTSQGQTVFNPLAGGFSGGSYGTNLQTVVQAIKSGNVGYTDGVNSLASLSPTAKADVLAALGPGFDTVGSDSRATARGSNIQTAGTAGVQANQQVFQKAYGDYTTLQNAVQNVDQFGQLLTQNMGGINPSDVKYANRTIAQIRNQLSSSQQAQFDSTLAALTSKVSGLLSVGGNEIPTDISSAANKIIDGSLPIGSLTAVLGRIQQEGNILLQNQAGIVNSAYSGLTGGSQGSPQNSNAQSNSLYNF